MKNPTLPALLGALLLLPAAAQQSFVNWETPHVSPIAHDAAGELLFVVNTPDNRLEVFDTSGAGAAPLYAVPVGLDPVSVRRRTADEVWVVNSISDSISVVDVGSRRVVRTIQTADEPADVVFAGTPERAFVTCSQQSVVQVFDPMAPGPALAVIPIAGEEPRAMAVNADGSEVYVAVFESGNGSTVLGGGIEPNGGMILALNNVVSDPLGPYGGQNPPPNEGMNFVPPQHAGNPAPPAVGLIVKKDEQGRWMDDNGGDWSDLVSGPNAARSNRPVGWDVSDHDIAVIDAQSLAVTYEDRLMTINMALAVHPTSGRVTVVGTDATNEVRFEPNLTARFVRVLMASVDPGGAARSIVDMNPHLDYQVVTLPQATIDLSIGDPRGIAWTADGQLAYVTGMGSNNITAYDQSGQRMSSPIEVGEGPTGIAIDGTRAFVLNKFDSSVSVVDLVNKLEIERQPLHDPSPEAVKAGRWLLYDTHTTSGLGHVSCASCHVDARTDRLAWDLGNPAGEVLPEDHQNLGMGIPGLTTGFEDFHPMKGPMSTQTMQDIIGKEPFHWRGDRDDLHGFAEAFPGLLGYDAIPSGEEFDQLEAFLGTIHFPPNPFRNFDNSLPTDVPLDGHYSAGRFSPPGTPLPNGNAQAGLNRYTPGSTLAGPFSCVTCHTLPTGLGTDMTRIGTTFMPIAPGMEGGRHHGLVSVDGSTNRTMKIAQLRNMYEKVGMELTQTESVAGFGFLHDGSIPSLAHFLSSPAFEFSSDQQLADMIAFMLAFSGSDLPSGSTVNILFPPGTPSKDAHAGVGTQLTFTDLASAPAADLALFAQMQSEASLGRVGVVAKGFVGGEARGYAYVPGAAYRSDREGESLLASALLGAATPAEPITLTVVPAGSETRIGIDRDEDGFLDRDELDAGSDPANASSVPDLGTSYCGPAVANSSGAPAVISAVGSRVAADAELTLHASSLPANQFGFFVASMTPAAVPGAGGSLGVLCIGGSVARFDAQIQNSGPSGEFSIAVDTTAIPTNPPRGVLAGETWHFQAWFRDSVGGQAASNFTDGLSVLFE